METPNMEKNIERRLEVLLREMEGIGDVLFGSVTVNRNRKARKKKPGVYVSPEHYTFNYKNAEGKRCWKRIPAGCIGRVRELVGAGKRWKKLEAEYEALATEAAWELAAGKKTSGCRDRG